MAETIDEAIAAVHNFLVELQPSLPESFQVVLYSGIGQPAYIPIIVSTVTICTTLYMLARLACMSRPTSDIEEPKSKKKTKHKKPARAHSSAQSDHDEEPEAATDTQPGISIKRAQKLIQKRRAKLKNQPGATSDLLVQTVKSHGRQITCVAQSPNDKLLAVGCNDGSCRIHVISTIGSASPQFFEIAMERDYPIAVHFAEDSRHLCIAGNSAGDLSWYALQRRPQRGTAPDLKKTIEGAYSTKQFGGMQMGSLRDDVIVATCGVDDDTMVRVWNHHGEALKSFPTNQVRNYGIRMSPDARFITAPNWTSEAHIWHIAQTREGKFASLNKVMVLRGHSKQITDAAFYENGNKIITCSADGTWKHWNLNVRYTQQEDPRLLHTVASPFHVNHMVATRDGKMVIIATDDEIVFCDGFSGKVIDRIATEAEAAPLVYLELSVLNTHLLTLFGPGFNCKLWRLPSVGGSEGGGGGKH